MISLRLRKIFYSAALGVDSYSLNKKEELQKLGELEKQILLAKKIMNSIEEKKEGDPAMLIRLEGKLKRIEKTIRDKKQLR
jgi:hypothetical protein